MVPAGADIPAVAGVHAVVGIHAVAYDHAVADIPDSKPTVCDDEAQKSIFHCIRPYICFPLLSKL